MSGSQARVFVINFVISLAVIVLAWPAWATPEPTLIRAVMPVYSQKAFDARQEGSVTIGFDIDETGKPTAVRILQSSAPAESGFNDAAIAAVRESRYAPFVVNGRNQALTGLTKTIDFRLSTAIVAGKPKILPKIHYPGDEAVLGMGGECDVDFVVNPDGSVSDPELVRSEGSPRFEDVCMNSVMSFRYEPPVFQGKPTSIALNFRFNFQPRSGISYLKRGQWVTMRYTLTRDGKTDDIEVVAKSSPDVLESKAKQQLAHMRFPPPFENGIPIDKPGQTFTIHGY